jgi:hypothetical protein
MNKKPKRRGLFNVVTLWEIGDPADHPISDNGANYRLIVQTERDQGNQMIVNSRAVAREISAD